MRGASHFWAPDEYRVTDPAVLHALVEAHPLATVIVHDGDMLYTAHTPGLLVDGRLFLHVANANPMAPLLQAGAGLTAMFRGPDCFVSAGWYARTSAPTWNYAVAYARAPRCRFVSDLTEAEALLAAFTAHFEARVNGPEAPLPADYVARWSAHITMVELLDTHWDGVFKLSQDRPAEREAVIAGLAALGGPYRETADFMRGGPSPDATMAG